MEETLQQEKQEVEYKNPDEDQGGIRRRLRDRDLLRKRKAEAEEKETNQWVFGIESQRKRSRADDKSGTKRRGRPRKSESTSGISVIQDEFAVVDESPAVVVVSQPAGIISDQTPGSTTPILDVEPSPVIPTRAYLPLFGSALPPVLTSPAPVNQTPALIPPSVSAPAPVVVLDSAPIITIQDPAPAPVLDAAPDVVPAPSLTQDPLPVPVAALTPPQVETLYTESQDREALDQVLIEDLGPDEEEDVSSSQDKGADEDLSETLSINIPEQNKMFTIPTFSSQPPSQEYFPGN